MEAKIKEKVELLENASIFFGAIAKIRKKQRKWNQEIEMHHNPSGNWAEGWMASWKGRRNCLLEEKGQIEDVRKRQFE